MAKKGKYSKNEEKVDKSEEPTVRYRREGNRFIPDMTSIVLNAEQPSIRPDDGQWLLAQRRFKSLAANAANAKAERKTAKALDSVTLNAASDRLQIELESVRALACTLQPEHSKAIKISDIETLFSYRFLKDCLDLTHLEFSSILGESERSLNSAYKSGKMLSTNFIDKFFALFQLYAAGFELFEDQKAINSYLRKEQLLLNGIPAGHPIEFPDSIDGIRTVRNRLGQIKAGVYA